jgi:hypothetical protein
MEGTFELAWTVDKSYRYQIKRATRPTSTGRGATLLVLYRMGSDKTMNVKTRRFVVARSRGAEGLACDSKVRSKKESTKEKNSSFPGGERAARNSGLNSFPGGGRAARNSGLKSSFPGGGRNARNSGLCGGDGWEARDSGEAGRSSGLAGGEGGAGRSSGDGTATYNCLFDVKM